MDNTFSESVLNDLKESLLLCLLKLVMIDFSRVY